jgi:hypothetical protein
MTTEELCEKYRIKNYTINDGIVDVDGNVNLPTNENFIKLPLRFGSVSGRFHCDHMGLITLEGCPKIVGGDFSCAFNDLTDLKHSPEEVGKSFVCGYNDEIYNLDGFYTKVGDVFDCRKTPLESIFNGVHQDFIDVFKTYKVVKGREVNLKRFKYVLSLFNMNKSSWLMDTHINKMEEHYTIV